VVLRLALIGIACSALAAAAQQERPTFRSDTSTVYVYATVQNRDGRLVTDLTRDDFEVLDDGKPRPVTVFAHEPQAITMAVMFDMSNSMLPNFDRLREAARMFVKSLWPEDRVRIGSFGWEVAISPLLTNDKATLLRIVDEELWPGGPTPLWMAVRSAMGALSKEPGRRVVLAFTDGGDAGIRALAIRDPLSDIRTLAERDNYMIYAIGLEGTGLSGEINELAENTGGGHFQVKRNDDLGATFAQVVEELHNQYLIGFSPQVLDGRAHSLTVKAKRPGLKVRARKSYVASVGESRVP
jgi:Ca-activated chloride channel family protein